MKIEKTHIDQIRISFERMQSIGDLLQLLNEVKPLIYGENAIPFELKQLTWYANPAICGKRYTQFKIKKKSGADRIINAPVNGLKSIQKTLSFVLQCVFEPHKAAMGFVQGKSIVDNAKIHEGSNYVFNIDLKDFFPSIDQARVWKCLQLSPFNLTKEATPEPQFMNWNDFQKEYLSTEIPVQFLKVKGRFFANTPVGTIYVSKNFDKDKDMFILQGGLSSKTIEGDSLEGTLWLVNQIPQFNRLNLANLIVSLCCTELEVERKNENGDWVLVKKNVLPQGAPTSPVITNIVCQRLDHLLTGVAKRFGLKYSRYADDITFSSIHNVYQLESEFQKEILRIIAEQGFAMNLSKTRLQKRGYRQEVTGLIVNEKANVQKSYLKQLRMWLYYWETYGIDKANVIFQQQQPTEKVQFKKGNPDMPNVISGKLEYLKMVKGENCPTYLKLRKRFDELVNPTLVYPALLIPFMHNPQDLVNLLKKFSINDSPLKYTTHSWDAGRKSNMFKDLSEYLAMAQEQYGKFSNQLIILKPFLNAKIYNFLFNEKKGESGWGEHRIKIGWSSPDLMKACNEDPDLNPEDFIIPTQYQQIIKGVTIQKFKHVIDFFKNEIEMRDENSALLNMIIDKHDKYLPSFMPPNIKNLDNKTFYTDVQWLSKALDLIFEHIQKRPQHRNIFYTVTETNAHFLKLEIMQKDSFNLGQSIHDEKLTLSKGDFSSIKEMLKNLCDWSVESKFAEGSYKINYLTSDPKSVPFEKMSNAEGFKHILTFH